MINIYEREIISLLEKLYPISRSILGEGFDDSLKHISKIVQLNRIKFETGMKAHSWTVPKEWTVREAWISDNEGNRIISFSDNPMHLWQYSVPIDTKITLRELEKHLFINEKLPDALSHKVCYYSNNWGFSITKDQRKLLNQDSYHVKIDSHFSKSNLVIGELLIPGRSKKEILFDAVLSSPSLANNTTGPVLLTFLALLILNRSQRNYSYRIVFSPETIGPLFYMSYLGEKLKNIIGGITLNNLGDRNKLHYKKSRSGQTLVDEAVVHSLKWFNDSYKIDNYNVMTGSCGNEKAYNSLGYELNIGSLTRSPLGSYPEYDTSSDDMSIISKTNLYKSFKVLNDIFETIEKNRYFSHNFHGEPFLTGYGLLPKINNEVDRIPYDYLMGFTDGKKSLCEIANLANLPINSFDQALNDMLAANLIREEI